MLVLSHDPSGKPKLTVDSTKLDESTSTLYSSSLLCQVSTNQAITKRLAFVGGFVVMRHGLLLSSMTENSSRISRVCLEVSNKPRCRCQVLATYANESSVRGGKCDDCRTSRRVLEEVGVYDEPRPYANRYITYPLADPHPSS